MQTPTTICPAIVSETYDRAGTPGLACRACNSAWPVDEGEEDFHHADDCAMRPSVRKAPQSTFVSQVIDLRDELLATAKLGEVEQQRAFLDVALRILNGESLLRDALSRRS